MSTDEMKGQTLVLGPARSALGGSQPLNKSSPVVTMSNSRPDPGRHPNATGCDQTILVTYDGIAPTLSSSEPARPI